MVSDTDFVALYQELELGPDCTLEQFKRAYRRRVGRLHPDLAGQPGDIARLQRLNRLYEAALAFQRLHGRLPGAPMPARGADAPDAAGGRTGAAAGTATGPARARTPGRPAQDMAGPASRLRYAIPITVVAAAAALLWLKLEDDAPPAGTAGAGTVRAAPAAAGGDAETVAGWIELGMEARQVLAIQGPPLNAYERRWDYGPSWIGFHCGRVVDWYSSPLRPLRVGSDSPAGDTGRIRDQACRGPHPIHGEP